MQINISSKLSLSGGCLKQFVLDGAACDIIQSTFGWRIFYYLGANK